MQKLEKTVGIEIEFFTVNAKDQVVIPSGVPTDDFPLMGEIRAEEGENVAEVYANFIREKMRVEKGMIKAQSMVFDPCRRVKLETYRKAMKMCDTPKNDIHRELHNIYNIDIADMSDQIIKAGKIQGINASCGLHIHFSCRKIDTVEVEIPEFEEISIPLATRSVPLSVNFEKENKELGDAIHASIGTEVSMELCRKLGYKTKKTLKAQASLLNKPTIEWMVKQLDDQFFARLMKDQSQTKYRHPGFYETKPYGFEYRSLPASKEAIQALPEIVDFGFNLLKEASIYA